MLGPRLLKPARLQCRSYGSPRRRGLLGKVTPRQSSAGHVRKSRVLPDCLCLPLLRYVTY
eukprot:scaffold109069_cov31-Tisochrysis_lutea.AAC.7